MSTAVALLAGIRNAPVIPAAIYTPPGATYPSRVLSYAPAHYWRLATDLTSSAGAGLALINPSNRVLFSRPTLVADSSGGLSASFSGSETAPAQLTTPGALGGVSAFTFACALQVDKRKVTGKHTIAHVKDTTIGAPSGDALGIELENDAGSGLRLRVYRWGEAASVRATRVFTGANAGVAIGSVIHLALRFGTDGSCTAFVDGSPVSLTPPATPPTSWPTFGDDVLYLGGYNNGASPFDGLLAEVAIFHSALSDAAILDIHGPTRKVAQVVYLADFGVGTLSGSGSIDPAAQETTHPAVGLTAIEDTTQSLAGGNITVSGGVWNYTAGPSAAAFSFTGRISKASVTSAPIRTISGAWATTVVAASWPCMDRVTGALDTSFANQTPSCAGMLTPNPGGNKRFDLRGTVKSMSLSATGKLPCTSARGLIRLLSGGFNGACFSGGAWICPNMEANWPDWNTTYEGNPRSPILMNGTTVIDVLFEGMRVHGSFDGVVIGLGDEFGSHGFTFRNIIMTLMRDDCIENDSKQSGVVVEDCYFSGFVGISTRGNQNGAGRTMALRRSLFELIPTMYQDVPNRTGGFFKLDETSPVISASDCVFAASAHHWNGDGNFQAIVTWDNAHGTWTNNDFCWLGALPYTKPLPAGVRLLTSATTPTAAQRLAEMKTSIWDQFPGHRFSFDPAA